jgi:hypothetical protein
MRDFLFYPALSLSLPMYNNDGGQGGARVCEAHEVK